MQDNITITSGGILYYRLYDVSWETDLLKVEQKVRQFKRLALERKLFSRAFEFANPPVTLKLNTFETPLNGRPRHVDAYSKLYEYGVISIVFFIRMDGSSLAEFTDTAKHIRDAEPLLENFRTELHRLMDAVKDAMTGVRVSEIEENYTVYYIQGTEPVLDADAFLGECNMERLMLEKEGEPPPGKAPMKELLSSRFSYSDRDLVVINWDNALVLEPSNLMDIPDLLEFASAQLLELRIYDQMLDRELHLIYDSIIPRKLPSIWMIKRYEQMATKLMRTITEITEITEKVDNSVKVTEDVYYAKIYSSAVALFKVKQWENTIRRKIDIASRVYDMVYRDISSKRIELLEVIIIVLIAMEIVLYIIWGL